MQRKAMLLAMTTHHVNVDFKKMLLRAWKWSEGPNSQDKTYRILKKRGPDSINKHTEMQQERYIFFTSHSVWKWQRKMEKNWVAALSDESEAEPWHRQTLCTVMGCWFQYMSVRLIQTTDKKKVENWMTHWPQRGNLTH